jgi:glutamyl-tRNA synthetase
MSWLIVKAQGGKIVLRIEDLDQSRSKQEYIDALMRDFEMLGLTWDLGPFFQSKSNTFYEEAYSHLLKIGAVYPCFCTRAQLAGANAPHAQDRIIYSGTCANLKASEVQAKMQRLANENRQPAQRLKVSDVSIAFTDLIQGDFRQNLVKDCGDFIVKRADGGYAYNLASVIDDARMGINMVVRGVDLLPATPGQIYIQQMLNLPEPNYAHVPLFCAADGRRLAKRNASASFDKLLGEFKTPEAIIGHVAFLAGLVQNDEPIKVYDLLDIYKEGGVEWLQNLWREKPSVEFWPA